MIAILLPDKSQNSVKNAFDELYEVFGHDRFKNYSELFLQIEALNSPIHLCLNKILMEMIELCYTIVILIVHIRKV